MEKYVFGVDVGGTTVKMGLFRSDGTVVDKWEIPTRTDDNGSQILPDIAVAVLTKIKDLGINKEDVEGIGIGVPGPVNEQGEVPVAVNLHWGYTRVAEDLSTMTGLKVRAGNDANVAALGEMWRGGGEGFKNLIMVTLGTGVGGGIIINGRIVYGTHGAAGEIGHAHVEDEITDPCNCGNCGCLEQVTSATGIVRLAEEAVASSDQPSLLRTSTITSRLVWDAVKSGDALAKQVAERFGMYLGKALSTFAVVCDPEVIVIGGGVSKAGPILLDYIVKYYRKYAFSACKDVDFALATLGNDAGIYGAAKLVLND